MYMSSSAFQYDDEEEMKNPPPFFSTSFCHHAFFTAVYMFTIDDLYVVKPIRVQNSRYIFPLNRPL